ncbi:MAG: hypothetical protein CMJ18_22510 [Phycisphaeraceae bacterium]|nr:hypothetical protein [Phycisphaeraceae bacterium]
MARMDLRILVTSDCTVCPQALDPLRRIAAVDCRFGLERDVMRRIVQDYDAIMCDGKVVIDRELLAPADRIRVVATPSTGTDHIDKPFLAERGIEFIALTTEYEVIEQFTATAEGGWALLLAAIRRIPSDFERAKRGERGLADPDERRIQLSGKTLGVMGYGRLGRMVGEYGKAFRMRVLAFDRKHIDVAGVTRVDLGTLVTESDVISLNLHLTDETRLILDRRRFEQMKRGVILVNTARGDLLDEDALVDALESGHVAAAGLDVVHGEWDPNLAEHRLHEYARTHDNLILTPHTASSCAEATLIARSFIASKLADRLRALMNRTG